MKGGASLKGEGEGGASKGGEGFEGEGASRLKGGGGASKGRGASRLKGGEGLRRGRGRASKEGASEGNVLNEAPPFDLRPAPPPLPATLEPRRVGPKPRKSGGPKGGGPKGGGPKGGGPKGGGPKGGGPNPEKVEARRAGARRVGGPKFRAFFPSSRHNFLSSFSLKGSFRGILVVFEAPGRSNVHVWSSRAAV